MRKPWDVLRDKPRIGNGQWATANNAIVDVRMYPKNSATIEIKSGIGGYEFLAEDLRQLSEFCTELADQLEGK